VSGAEEVGLVTPIREVFSENLALASGQTLAGFELITETYGQLNSQRSNAVLICHALAMRSAVITTLLVATTTPIQNRVGGTCMSAPEKRLIQTVFLWCHSTILGVVTAVRAPTQ